MFIGVGLVLFWPALFFMLGNDQEEERQAERKEMEREVGGVND